MSREQLADAGPGAGFPSPDGVIPERAFPAKRLVVVVGPCASGKSTLVAGLRRLGYDAVVCGQEHSDIPTLWRHVDPDLVVALDIDLPTLRSRRDDAWPEWLLLLQRRRLANAAAAAHLRLDTSRLDAADVLTRVAARLASLPLSHP